MRQEPFDAQPLFPAFATRWLRWGLVGVLLLAVGAPLGLMGWVRTPIARGQYTAPPQPIQFDHRHHVRDVGIGCRYCHADAWRTASAGLPALSVCMGCHVQVYPDAPLLKPLRDAYFGGSPLVWQRVTWLPDFVFFDHSAHVTRGVACVSCHGRVDLMPQVYAVATMTMGFCLDCHRQPDPSLRPVERVGDMEWTHKAERESAGAQVASAARPGTDCSTCHR